MEGPGRLGPANASFQAMVTAMRLSAGEEKTKQWLVDLKKNEAKTYEKNTPIVEALATGEIDLGRVNHYYLALVKEEQPDAPIANHFLAKGDAGALRQRRRRRSARHGGQRGRRSGVRRLPPLR